MHHENTSSLLQKNSSFPLSIYNECRQFLKKMNGVMEDGEGFLLFVINYGVGISESQGVGSGDGGLDLK
jgi:hypothetical protein